MIAARNQIQPVVENELSQESAEKRPEDSPEVTEARQLSKQILQDAEMLAEQLISQANEQSSQMQEETRQKMEEWWEQRREEDKQLAEQARTDGYEQGYERGYSEAEQQLRQQYENTISEAQTILERAHQLKEQIIQEAEPFLLEISFAIAEKIMDQQLSIAPEGIVHSIKKLLARRSEQGLITLCVSPAQFDSVMNAREELAIALDSQAELQIIPDARIKDHGCILRTSFGSVDATVGTQLQEIKAALKQIAVHYESRTTSDRSGDVDE